MVEKVLNKNAGIIKVKAGKNPRNLYLHQNEAIKALNQNINKRDNFKGLLVIPTGGGKTLTAVQWVLKNIIDEGKKVLWIAHRHELLNQALDAVVNNSYSDIMKNRKQFSFRVLSGMHDRPVNIREEDDFIIASKDSLNHGINYLINNWVGKNLDNLFLVIDEAHHSTAKSYRKIIDRLSEENKNWFKLLGLTATPFRTSESEKGLLKTVFEDDIVYGVDLKTLINREILADPVFIELNTKIDMTNDLTERDIKSIQAFDSLPEDIAEQIARNKDRNSLIVNHYLENEDKYGQTLVFAVNVEHAIELNALFNKYKIPSDFVVSSIKDMYTGVTISNEENAEKLQRFRNGELKVLVNVNILTEGTDLPGVQTAFLTRPTTSTILMTQMIGRALRGKKSGGTDKAYIVSFIDSWKDKISWVNPQRLYDGMGTNEPNERERKEQVARLIAISKIEEFARIMDETVDTADIENLDFAERVPVGVYSFSILIPSKDGEPDEKNCDILVYDCLKQAYEDFINDLDYIFEEKKVEEKEFLDDYELDYLCNFVKKEYFEGYDKTLGYRDEDIKDILRYYALKETKPSMLKLEDRENFDVSKIAKYMWDEDMGARTQQKYIDELWTAEGSFWKLFFGSNKKYFVNAINLELYKLNNSDDELEREKPEIIEEQIELSKLSLSEIRRINPVYWRKIVNSVYNRSRDSEGYYHSAISDFKSNKKRDFQIDHIKPMSKGGLTELSNLQLLTRAENMIKGDQYPFYDVLEETAVDKEDTKKQFEAFKSLVKAVNLKLVEEDNIDKFKKILLKAPLESDINVDLQKIKLDIKAVSETYSSERFEDMEEILFYGEEESTDVLEVKGQKHQMFLAVGPWGTEGRFPNSHITLGTTCSKFGEFFSQIELSHCLEDEKRIYIVKNISKLAGQGAISRLNNGLKKDKDAKHMRRELLVERFEGEVLRFNGDEWLSICSIDKEQLEDEMNGELLVKFLDRFLTYSLLIEEIIMEKGK